MYLRTLYFILWLSWLHARYVILVFFFLIYRCVFGRHNTIRPVQIDYGKWKTFKLIICKFSIVFEVHTQVLLGEIRFFYFSWTPSVILLSLAYIIVLFYNPNNSLFRVFLKLMFYSTFQESTYIVILNDKSL